MSRACLAVFALVACQKLSAAPAAPPPEPTALQLLEEQVPASPTFTGQVVPARPALKAAEVQAAPSLASRAEDGKPEVNFALQHTRVSAKVSGSIARVEVTQLYKNPSA